MIEVKDACENGVKKFGLRPKIGGGSEVKIKTSSFILHFTRLALSLQKKNTR